MTDKKDCLHELNKKVICIHCNEKFKLKHIPCKVNGCNDLALIIVDKFGGIVNTKMFYTCEKHNEKIEKAFKEYNELMIHNEKEIEKSITEALKKQLDKIKKEMH